MIDCIGGRVNFWGKLVIPAVYCQTIAAEAEKKRRPYKVFFTLISYTLEKAGQHPQK